MKPAGIKITGINKTFFSLTRGRIIALHNMNLGIRHGEFFVVLGPSGCGKSTLLNIVAGLEKQTSGEVSIGDQCVSSVDKRIFFSPKQRNVAMVFQSYALYPHLTVFDNIAFPLKIAHHAKADIETQVKTTACMLHIEHLLTAKPKELSGGQKQRVAIARALVRRPVCFLLDEPLSNIDAQLRVRMRTELKQLQRSLMITTIYVTHDQVEAMTLGDRIAIIKDGHLQQVGKPVEVYNAPNNLFVASFLGTPSMNLLNAKVLEKNGRLSIMIDEMVCMVSHDQQKMLRYLLGQEITVGVRPEHVAVTSDSTAQRQKERIQSVEYLGNELILHFRIGTQELVAKVTHDRIYAEDQEIGITLNQEKLHFFDNEGNRIKEL